MKNIFVLIGAIAFLYLPVHSQNYIQNSDTETWDDMLTPAYYLPDADTLFINEVDRFVFHARKIPFQDPLADSSEKLPLFIIPVFGKFGAGKGPGKTQQHHPAIDFKVGVNETKVPIYASHDGVIEVFRDAPKYRHYISISKQVKNDSGNILGKMVTIYGHVDLDLDSAQQLLHTGKIIRKGELISQNLYSKTVGGPHLHFEIRYYRKTDSGREEFYGFKTRTGNSVLTQLSAGKWNFGVWHPEIGYGFAHPKNHIGNF